MSRREAIDIMLAVLRRARDQGVLVVGVSQVGRGYYIAGDRSPVNALAASKESGAVEYKADLLLGFKNVSGSPDEIEVEVAKSRLGAIPDMRLGIDRARADLREIDRPPTPSKEDR
jgi:hypothetical protein